MAARLYGEDSISERHRHRYEINNDYRERMAKHGMVFSGVSPDYRLVEIIELPSHPYFIGTQFHPEFRSRPNRAHPLFVGLVAAAIEHRATHPAVCEKAPVSMSEPAKNGRGKNGHGGALHIDAAAEESLALE
jgi:CTP synthase